MLDLAVPNQLWFTLETLVQSLHMALRKQASALSGKNAGEFIEKLQAAAWKRVDNDNEVSSSSSSSSSSGGGGGNKCIFDICSSSQ
jgi:hypothetical protein